MQLHTLRQFSRRSFHQSRSLSMSEKASILDNTTVRSTTASGSMVYESSRAVHEYLQFHYGKKEDILPYAKAPHDALNFIHDTVLGCASKIPESRRHRALDIGCAVGGSTFELARYFDQVAGIDFSHSFIETANAMKDRGHLTYDAITEGRQTETRSAQVLVSEIEREKVAFAQGDACTLCSNDTTIGTFDAVLASNLLCRLPEPEIFLRSLKHLVNPDGIVALISPYSWLEEYTVESKWLGGRKGSTTLTRETVTTIMALDFDLLDEEEYPFLIREHARKYQWGTSNGTFWKKRKA